jgi:hypothetical protein
MACFVNLPRARGGDDHLFDVYRSCTAVGADDERFLREFSADRRRRGAHDGADCGVRRRPARGEPLCCIRGRRVTGVRTGRVRCQMTQSRLHGINPVNYGYELPETVHLVGRLDGARPTMDAGRSFH